MSRKRRSSKPLPANDARHGTRTGYDYWRCRCQACKDDHTRLMIEYLNRHPEQRHKQNERNRWDRHKKRMQKN